MPSQLTQLNVRGAGTPAFAVLDKCEMDELMDAVIPCPDCEARGFLISDDDPVCPLCHGASVIPRPGGPLQCSSN